MKDSDIVRSANCATRCGCNAAECNVGFTPEPCENAIFYRESTPGRGCNAARPRSRAEARPSSHAPEPSIPFSYARIRERRTLTPPVSPIHSHRHLQNHSQEMRPDNKLPPD